MTMGTALGRAVATVAIVLCAATARAEPADPCAAPGYLLFGDSLLERVAAAAKNEKALNIVVLGGASSTLPGPAGASFAFPARLEVALARRLPNLKVSVTADIRSRQMHAVALSGELRTVNLKPFLTQQRLHFLECPRSTPRTMNDNNRRFRWFSLRRLSAGFTHTEPAENQQNEYH